MYGQCVEEERSKCGRCVDKERSMGGQSVDKERSKCGVWIKSSRGGKARMKRGQSVVNVCIKRCQIVARVWINMGTIFGRSP